MMAEQEKWLSPLESWRRIFRETPDYDCWPAPIRGWEVGALIGRIDQLEADLAAKEREFFESLDREGKRVEQLQADLRAANETLAFILEETSTGYCRECGFLTFFEKDGEMQHTLDCPTLAAHRQRVGEG